MRLNRFLLLVLSSFLLFGCKSNSGIQFDSDTNTYHYPGQDMKERDVDYPTKISYTKENSVRIHYHRDDNKYASYSVYLYDLEKGMPEEVLNKCYPTKDMHTMYVCEILKYLVK